jgi:hypothetical protein
MPILPFKDVDVGIQDASFSSASDLAARMTALMQI